MDPTSPESGRKQVAGEQLPPPDEAGSTNVVVTPDTEGVARSAARSTSGVAITSLVLSIVWIGGLGSIVGVILGFLARRDIRRSNGAKGGSGFALAGIIIGFAGLLGLGLWVVLTAVLGTPARTLGQDLPPKTVPFGTTVNVSNSGLNPGLKDITVFSLSPVHRIANASSDEHVVTARLRLCADSHGSQAGFDFLLLSVYFADGDFGLPSVSTIVHGEGTNLTGVNNLAPKQCVSGYVPFDLVKGSAPIGVSYSPGVIRTVNWTEAVNTKTASK
jgi:hypothetical protein